MDEKTRQFVLLIGLMLILGTIFAVINTSNLHQPPENNTGDNKTQKKNDKNSNIFEQSINGLKALVNDIKKGFSSLSNSSSN